MALFIYDDPLRLDDALEDAGTLVFRVTLEHERQGLRHLLDRLVELRLGDVLALDVRHEAVHVLLHRWSSAWLVTGAWLPGRRGWGGLPSEVRRGYGHRRRRASLLARDLPHRSAEKPDAGLPLPGSLR